MKRTAIFFSTILFFLAAKNSFAGGHLWWDNKNIPAKYLYGEISVLASNTAIYYSGVNWHPGEPAGGYCGIQDNSTTERRTIFSIWDTDTAKKQRPSMIHADSQTIFNSFDNEGSGMHSHMVIKWNVGETFMFFLSKSPSGAKPNSIDTAFYFFDRTINKWRHMATITNPIGNSFESVSTFGGGMNSFLENFANRDLDVAKIALYRLWSGNDLDNMMPLTEAIGDGVWGKFSDTFFLAEGSKENLNNAFAKWKQYGTPLYAKAGEKMPPLPAKKIPLSTISQLKNLPTAPYVR